jgi:hypothetical protein
MTLLLPKIRVNWTGKTALAKRVDAAAHAAAFNEWRMEMAATPAAEWSFFRIGL